MRFYTNTRQYTCGIDLHTQMMYACILDGEGNVVLHRNIPTDPGRFLELIAPYSGDLVVGCECTFSWYWLADLCLDNGIEFIVSTRRFLAIFKS